MSNTTSTHNIEAEIERRVAASRFAALSGKEQMEILHPAQPITASFEVGETYSCRSIGDFACVWAYTIEARTAKFVTIDVWGEKRRVGVKVDRDGVEYVLPHGNYSMATVLRASEIVR